MIAHTEQSHGEITTGIFASEQELAQLMALIRVTKEGKTGRAMTIIVDGKSYQEPDPHWACNRLAMKYGLPALPDNWAYGITQQGEFTADAEAWRQWSEDENKMPPAWLETKG